MLFTCFQLSNNHKRSLKKSLRDSHQRQARLDTLGRSNENKRGPKTGPSDHILRVNHTHAVCCRDHGYAYKPGDILTDERYQELCATKPKPVVFTARESKEIQRAKAWVKKHGHML